MNLPHSMTSLVPNEGKLVHLDLQKPLYQKLPPALAITQFTETTMQLAMLCK